MQAIFQEHGIASTAELREDRDDEEVASSSSFDRKLDDQMFNVPVTLAIEQSII